MLILQTSTENFLKAEVGNITLSKSHSSTHFAYGLLHRLDNLILSLDAFSVELVFFLAFKAEAFIRLELVSLQDLVMQFLRVLKRHRDMIWVKVRIFTGTIVSGLV